MFIGLLGAWNFLRYTHILNNSYAIKRRYFSIERFFQWQPVPFNPTTRRGIAIFTPGTLLALDGPGVNTTLLANILGKRFTNKHQCVNQTGTLIPENAVNNS